MRPAHAQQPRPAGAGGHAGAAGAQRVAPGAAANATFGVRVAHTFGLFVHSIIFSLGLVFLLHVAYVGSALNAQGQWSSAGTAVGSFKDATIVLLRNFLLGFAEASFLDPMMPESSGIDVWGFWVPGLLSVFFLIVAWLGLATIRCRRPSRAVPYALFAAVFLVWQAQVGQALVEISTWEDLGPSTGRSQLTAAQQVQQDLFKVTSQSFTQFYAEQQCQAAQRVDNLPQQMRCDAETMEAKLMQLTVQEFCRARTEDVEVEFAKRVKACKEQGQRLRLFGGGADSDAFYCRCWTSLFDALQGFARWIMIVWFVMLVGVLSVLYIAAEPKLARMCAREHTEVLCFACLSMAFLACRVTLFPDGLALSRGFAGLLQEE